MTRTRSRHLVGLACVAIIAASAGCHAAAARSIATPQAPTAAARQTPVTWLVFVDDLHLDFRNTGRIRDVVRRLTAALIQDGDTFAIAASGPSALALDATLDRQAVAGAIKRVTGNGLRMSDIVSNDPAGGDEVRYRASTALTRAQEMLKNASRFQTRKAMLYISNGYDFEALPEPSAAAAPPRTERGATRAQLRAQLAALIETASRGGVTVFAIDPAAGEDLDDPRTAAWEPYLAARRTSLAAIAGSTGGFVLSGPAADATATRRIADKMRN